VPDHDRPLAPRGKKATRVVARHCNEAQVRPALVLCSTAARTRETLAGVVASLGDEVDVWHEEDLYGASSEELLARLRRLPSTVPSVMIVGHNPGLEDLALELVGAGDQAAIAKLHAKFPTGALASLLISSEWNALGRGEATLTGYVLPRDLV
jgi:phosphohistidine phosphatase